VVDPLSLQRLHDDINKQKDDANNDAKKKEKRERLSNPTPNPTPASNPNTNNINYNYSSNTINGFVGGTIPVSVSGKARGAVEREREPIAILGDISSLIYGQGTSNTSFSNDGDNSDRTTPAGNHLISCSCIVY
jgi:hypothetical protein